ncbi:methyltransferase family protein [Chloroflexota bacterium]
MLYIIIGAVGFVVVHIFDLVALKRIPRLKPVIWCIGSGLLIYSLVMICRYPVKIVLPAWSTWLGWGMLAVSASLLIHSLFISLPFRKTYVDTGVGDKLVKSGLYALVRHPGILWFPLFMLSLIPISRSSLLLIAAPTFIVLDIVLVVIQDKLIFGRMFHGYDSYRRETPMLLPNRKSFGAFLRSLRQVKSQ